VFFPEPNVVLDKDSYWGSFVTEGYVKRYHEAILDSTDGGELIRDMLDKTFENLQVLSFNPGRQEDKKLLWNWEDNALLLLFNSWHILLMDRTLWFGGETGREVRVRGELKQKSNKQLMKLVMECAVKLSTTMPRVVQRATTTEAKQLMQGRRGKQKNYQRPPTKQKPAGS